MITTSKKVIWGSSKHWGSFSPVGSHGYAKEFVKNGWKVAFLSSNITPLHMILTRDEELYQERKLIHDTSGKWYEENKLWDYVPWSMVSDKIFPRSWLKLDLGDLNRALKKNGFDSNLDLVWLDNTEFGPLFDLYPHAKHVIRIADRNAFLSKTHSRRNQKYEMELIKRADHVIVVSFALEEDLRNRGKFNVLRIPNGFNQERFISDRIPPRPMEYKDISSPIAVFVGMIEHWFDVELLAQVAQKLEQVSFTIIGKPMVNLSKLEKLKNVHILGQRDPSSISSYLHHSDVGIIPFVMGPLHDAINPVKYFEYIACGLPVVATESMELRLLGEPIYLAKNYQEFSDYILEALTLNQEYKSFLKLRAQEMTWNARWQTIMNKIYPEENTFGAR